MYLTEGFDAPTVLVHGEKSTEKLPRTKNL